MKQFFAIVENSYSRHNSNLESSCNIYRKRSSDYFLLFVGIHNCQNLNYLIELGSKLLVSLWKCFGCFIHPQFYLTNSSTIHVDGIVLSLNSAILFQLFSIPSECEFEMFMLQLYELNEIWIENGILLLILLKNQNLKCKMILKEIKSGFRVIRTMCRNASLVFYMINQ